MKNRVVLAILSLFFLNFYALADFDWIQSSGSVIDENPPSQKRGGRDGGGGSGRASEFRSVADALSRDLKFLMAVTTDPKLIQIDEDLTGREFAEEFEETIGKINYFPGDLSEVDQNEDGIYELVSAFYQPYEEDDPRREGEDGKIGEVTIDENWDLEREVIDRAERTVFHEIGRALEREDSSYPLNFIFDSLILYRSSKSIYWRQSITKAQQSDLLRYISRFPALSSDAGYTAVNIVHDHDLTVVGPTHYQHAGRFSYLYGKDIEIMPLFRWKDRLEKRDLTAKALQNEVSHFLSIGETRLEIQRQEEPGLFTLKVKIRPYDRL